MFVSGLEGDAQRKVAKAFKNAKPTRLYKEKKMKNAIAIAGLLLLATSAAHAQLASNGGGAANNRGGAGNGGAGAVIPLPQGVKRVISIDAYNTLLAETGEGARSDYTLIPIRHVYSGGIAALFGGISIPTALFVSPGAAAGFGGGNGFGVSGFNGGGVGGVNGFNGSGINNGFNGAGNGAFQNPDGSFGNSQTSLVGPNGQLQPLQNGPFFGPTF